MSGSNRLNDSYPPDASPACERVRPALSEYVDGVLPDPQSKAVQLHLEACPACLEIFAAFKRVQSVCDAEPVVPDTDFWSSISKTLQADRQAHPETSSCGFEPEFIFAYLDGEPVDSAEKSERELERFESHLFACTPCNEQIADADALSMLLKDWHFRLEERLGNALEPLQLSERVMAQYQSETPLQESAEDFLIDDLAQHKPCDVMTWETLSVFLDGELPDDERLSVKKHLSGCQPCTRVMNAYQAVQSVYQTWSQGLETFAPDLRDQVMQAYQSGETVSETIPENANPTVIQGPAKWFSKKSAWLALPTIAAAMMLLVMATRPSFLTGGQSQDSARLAQSSSQAPSVQVSADMMGAAPEMLDASENNHQEAQPAERLEMTVKTAVKTAAETAAETAMAPFSKEPSTLSSKPEQFAQTKDVDDEGKATSTPVIAAAPPASAPMSPSRASSVSKLEMEADRQYAEETMSGAPLGSASNSMAGASAPKAKKNTANSDRREREQRDKRDQKESRLPLGEVSGNTSAAPSSGRKQRANEKIAYIPSAEEYLYAQHRRRIYSDEMSAMMGGEGTP